jgi:rhodanese-related sulfurtransferase
MPASLKINKRSTMQEVLDAYPSAQRALFRKYHIGGCHSCGYEPNDVLEDVAGKHNLTNMDEVLNFIVEAEEIDKRIQVTPAEVSAALKSDKPPRLIDVRTPQEWEMAKIPGAQLITEELSYEIMNWPKDTPMVFHCHHGQRSMDAASYFAGHGFTNAKSMTGGIDAWSETVDPSVPRYEIARDPSSGRPKLQPLRLVVSKAEGCMNP